MNKEAHKIRVLCVAEAVTLAHTARLHVLANSLSPEKFTVLFAGDQRFERLFTDAKYPRQAIHSVSTAEFLNSIAQGSPLYRYKTLQAYVAEEIRIIDNFRPDIIIGDFRLSLSISARVSKVPYIALANAYWSSKALVRLLAPQVPLINWVGPFRDLFFRAVRPMSFAYHSRPLNKVRKAWGLSSLGNDMRLCYHDADYRLYADIPELVPLSHLDANEHFIGPISWSPSLASPEWLNQIDRSKPTIYLNLGSSGDPKLLPGLVSALSSPTRNLIVATAGEKVDLQSGSNVFVGDYLPGDKIAELAAVVICNGGSPSCQQALLGGAPVIGVTNNLDQILNMETIESAGVGTHIRPCKRAYVQNVVRAVEASIANPAIRERVAQIRNLMLKHSADFHLERLLEDVVAKQNANPRVATR